MQKVAFILMLVFSTTCWSREHKVHNVVLYPDRHAWCDVTTIQQVISHPGCQSKTIENNVCVGTCFSLSVPRTIPETPGDETLHYCDSCQSSLSKWTQVDLECPEDPELERLTKQVEIISNCSCSVCSRKGTGGDSNTVNDSADNDIRMGDDGFGELANERRLMEEPQRVSRENASSLHALLGETEDDDNADDLDQLIYVTPTGHDDVMAGSGDDWTENRVDASEDAVISNMIPDGDA